MSDALDELRMWLEERQASAQAGAVAAARESRTSEGRMKVKAGLIWAGCQGGAIAFGEALAKLDELEDDE